MSDSHVEQLKRALNDLEAINQVICTVSQVQWASGLRLLVLKEEACFHLHVCLSCFVFFSLCVCVRARTHIEHVISIVCRLDCNLIVSSSSFVLLLSSLCSFLQTLKDEMQALQLLQTSTEAKLKKLELENADLVSPLLHLAFTFLFMSSPRTVAYTVGC